MDLLRATKNPRKKFRGRSCRKLRHVSFIRTWNRYGSLPSVGESHPSRPKGSRTCGRKAHYRRWGITPRPETDDLILCFQYMRNIHVCQAKICYKNWLVRTSGASYMVWKGASVFRPFFALLSFYVIRKQSGQIGMIRMGTRCSIQALIVCAVPRE